MHTLYYFFDKPQVKIQQSALLHPTSRVLFTTTLSRARLVGHVESEKLESPSCGSNRNYWKHSLMRIANE